MSAVANEFRPPTEAELAILSRLFEADFPGREALRAQARNCKVRTIDDAGSLEFQVSGNLRAWTEQSVPIEAEVEDEDGALLHVLLHVKDGVIRELEYYKESADGVIRKPRPEQWRLVRLPPPTRNR
jgi:hypothetical protein